MIPSPANPEAMLSALKQYLYSDLRVLQFLCRDSFRTFAKVFFKERTGQKLIWNWHLGVLCNVLQKVVEGKIPRLIVDLPPGFSKTEIIIRLFNAYTYAVNPRAKNLHLSYSADLAWDSSSAVKDILTSDLFQALYPGRPRTDTHAKRTWRTETGGMMVAGSIGGQVTGQRAGRLEPGFSGVLTVDDPIKPEDVYFNTIREKRNRSFKTTIRSRLARPEIPIVIVMQRLHDDDPVGFCLRGGTGDKWYHLVIPAEIEQQQWADGYPEEYTHGIPINYLAPIGFTWPLKVDEVEADKIKSDMAIWLTQFQQDPTTEQGEVFHDDWWQCYSEYDAVNSAILFEDGSSVPIVHKGVYADTAMKTAEQNDFSSLQCWAFLADGRIAKLDNETAKWEAPDLQDHFLNFCDRHAFQTGVNNMGVRSRKVEDKASGTGLIQAVNRMRGDGYVEGIPRDKDKVSRAKGCAPEIKKGKVLLPKSAPWLSSFLQEFHKFKASMTHKHDDQVDAAMDAIEDNLIRSPGIGYSRVI